MQIIILGLSITSSWGNGHATNYRGLVRALAARGHDVLFLERDRSWYARHRDMPRPPWGRTALYRSMAELRRRFGRKVRDADAVIVGSYVPRGAAVAGWVARTARGLRVFYDIDTPVTLAKLERGEHEYLTPALVPEFDLYLSFTGGPTLQRLERVYGSPLARPFYCMVDPEVYCPANGHASGAAAAHRYDLGYIGTYSLDRQPRLERLLVGPARREPERRFVVAGPQYPRAIRWPSNVRRIDHLPPPTHRGFYASQRFTLNITRADMRRAGYSPSVRLFEAAACGTPIVSDPWPGLESFFEPGREILVAASGREVLRHLESVGDRERAAMAARARRRILQEHTAEHRATQLEAWLEDARRLRAACPFARRGRPGP